jgi:hypothetical protein
LGDAVRTGKDIDGERSAVHEQSQRPRLGGIGVGHEAHRRARDCEND